MRILLMAAGLALMSGPTLAADTGAEAANGKDRVICKSERPTGSRIVQEICLTKGEWEEVTDRSRKAIDKVRSDTSTRVVKSQPGRTE